MPPIQEAFYDGYIYGTYNTSVSTAAALVTLLRLNQIKDDGKVIAWIHIDGALTTINEHRLEDFAEGHIANTLEQIAKENRDTAIRMILRYRLDSGPRPLPEAVQGLAIIWGLDPSPQSPQDSGAKAAQQDD